MITRPTLTQIRRFAQKVSVKLNAEVKELIEKEDIKPRKHPGIIKSSIVELPEWVKNAINVFMIDKYGKQIRTEAQKFGRSLQGRLAPIESGEMKNKYEDLQNAGLIKQKLQDAPLEDMEKFRNNNHKKVLKLLNSRICNAGAIEYNTHRGKLYAVARAAPDFAILSRVFQEITARDATFRPQTIFDFGSGIGTVLWAATKAWPDSIKEYFGVDIAVEMNDLSEQLAKNAMPKVRTVYRRQFFPASPTPSYDVTVSAFSLLELPNAEARLESILKLWRKTGHYMVLVEQGTNAGFGLQKSGMERDPKPAYVFAPCPHDLACPRYLLDHTPCNFSVPYMTNIPGPKSHLYNARFSYVIIKKSERPDADEKWPRIVRPVLVRSRHSVCRMCTASGELKEVIFTASKFGKMTYHCARSSNWGDRLPVSLEQISEENSEENGSDGSDKDTE
ncbi:methyltransferase-like protein 17, mitochondrial isoform X1 [Orussus abietinus]|uniref:methyltransferase-like protein 17, mitochondrial isoform X1 n=1 Tax=Orussus abietinus TaxID=222816 RepID=UPI000C715FEE|nr:methyltransferase-like protein 17, mitochondrial isoform X1 [Orussus abietinus]